MPRDNWCPGCGGMYADDEIEDGRCIYCNAGVEGVESGAEAEEWREKEDP